MKHLKLTTLLLFASFCAMGQTKPDTNKYHLPFKRENLDYLTKKVMHIDSVIVNSNLPAKDAFQAMEFLNSLQDAFLQNYKTQLAEIEKQKTAVKVEPKK